MDWFVHCYRKYDLAYITNWKCMRFKTLSDDIKKEYKNRSIVVACAFVEIEDTDVRIHYLATKPLYECLNYARMLIGRLEKSLLCGTACRRVTIASYPDVEIGLVNLNDARKYEYPIERLTKLRENNDRPITGFVTKHGFVKSVGNNDMFYTNNNNSGHNFWKLLYKKSFTTPFNQTKK